jgi:N,N'-diacetyllegionaminate synthase
MMVANCDTGKRVFLVAEIGNNHEGDFSRAEELVRSAADCGVDAVKFQIFRARDFVSRRDRERFDRMSRFELSWDQFERLAALARSLNLAFLSTPLDIPSAEFLSRIGDGFKIASCDNNFYPLMARVASAAKPVILSAGMAGWKEIADAKKFIEDEWARRNVSPGFGVLHCVSAYPVPDAEANLLVVPRLAEMLACTVGYSDHTLGIDACLAAVALGARIIEKHFTLDKKQSSFRDHQLSADPGEMSQIVRCTRRIETLLGRAEKAVQPCEVANQRLLRRAIVAARDLDAGDQLTFEDLSWVRPADGLAPGNEHLLVGRTLARDVSCGEPLTRAEVK